MLANGIFDRILGDNDGMQDNPMYFQCWGEIGGLQSNIGPQGLLKTNLLNLF